MSFNIIFNQAPLIGDTVALPRILIDQLFDADAILSDISHEISSYMEDMSFDEEEYRELEERLDVIHNLEAKYGKTAEQIQENLENKRKRLEELEDYDALKQRTEQELEETESRLEVLCGQLSEMRKAAAKELTAKIDQADTAAAAAVPLQNRLQLLKINLRLLIQLFTRIGRYGKGTRGIGI